MITMNQQAMRQILVRTRDELLAMSYQLRDRAQEIQFQIDHHHVAAEPRNGFYYYHSDGSDGYSDTESDQSDVTTFEPTFDDIDTDDGYPTGPEFEDSGSGETMSDRMSEDTMYETSSDDDIDDDDDRTDYDDYDSELNQLDVTVMSSTSLSDFSDF